MSGDDHNNTTETGPAIVSNPRIHGGEPVMAGTRIQAAFVASLVRDGLSNDEIREWYPPLTDWHLNTLRGEVAS